MQGVDDIFHIFTLRKYISDEASRVVIDFIDIQYHLTYIKESVKILEYDARRMHNRDISFVEILWKNGSEKNATLKKKLEMRE